MRLRLTGKITRSGRRAVAAATALTAAAFLGTTPSAGASSPASAPSAARAQAIKGVEAWGYGATGELGDDALGTATVPVAVPGLSGVESVSAGAHHSLALLAGGTVMAWGQNDFGQLGQGSHDAFSTVPVPVKDLSGVTAVSAGDGHSLALLSNGTVMAWGEDAYGQLGNGKHQPFSALPVPVTGLTGVTAVVAGNRDSFALLANGTVLAWGNDTQGQLGDGRNSVTSDVPVPVKNLTGVTQVAAGGEHTVALLKTGIVKSWGFGLDGELGDGHDINSAVPVQVSNLSHVTAVTAGDSFDLALLADGHLQGWGDNIDGELGNPAFSAVPLPVPVTGVGGVIAITSGDSFSLALTSTGTVFGWGDNSFGEMAGAASTSVVQPAVALGRVTNAVSLSAGGIHALVAVSAPGGAGPAGPGTYGFAVTPTNFADIGGPLTETEDTIAALSAASTSDAWAIVLTNDLSSAGNTSALHWDGTSWSPINFAPPSTGTSQFGGIFDAGPGNAWAVGTRTLPDSDTRTIIEHWTGASWRIVPSPDPITGVGGFDSLQAVAGNGPDDIWAIGDDFLNVNGATINILLAHFDGTRWTAVHVPEVGAFDFGNAVAVASPTDAWAVGTEARIGNGDLGIALHWDGAKWSVVPVPAVGVTQQTGDRLTGVTIPSAADVWVSAYNDNAPGASVPYLLHFNGTAFEKVAVPSPGGPQANFHDTGTFLTGISSTSPDDIYAVGFATFNDATELGLVEHYDGTSWSPVPVPQPGDRGALGEVPGELLLAVSDAGRGAVFLAGAQSTPLMLFGTIPLAMMPTKA